MRRRAFVLVLSGAMTSARGLRAQQNSVPVVGYLGTNLLGPASQDFAAFRQGLSEAGYVEGKNLSVDLRWAGASYDRMPALASDLVGRKVDVIVVGGTRAIAAAKAATSTIPIVFFGGGDLVASGIVASLARPGGNITGIGIFGRELNPKRLELLAELIPRPESIGLLLNPSMADSEEVMRDVQEAARVIGRQLSILKASTESEIDAAFTTLVQLRAGGLVVPADPFFNGQREKIVSLAARHASPGPGARLEPMSAGFLLAPILPICQFSGRRGSNWSSISRPPRLLG